MDDSRIIVDGLFRYGHNRYPTPDTAVIRLMTGNLEPFKGIDLILVTHTHVDHFDRHLVSACMLNNPATKLICTGQAVDSLRLDTLSFGRIEGRIIQCSPELNRSKRLFHGDIEIHACRFPHVGGAMFAATEHVAFLITGKSGSVFHSGDIDPFQTEGYEGIKINEQDVDVGLLNEDFSKPANASLASEFINARNNVAMHLPEPQSAEWNDTVMTNPRLFRNPYIFTRSLERRNF
jgi:L-ascorbate metabolism protein UlaG (beta-lactamase superfamily)